MCFIIDFIISGKFLLVNVLKVLVFYLAYLILMFLVTGNKKESKIERIFPGFTICYYFFVDISAD